MAGSEAGSAGCAGPGMGTVLATWDPHCPWDNPCPSPALLQLSRAPCVHEHTYPLHAPACPGLCRVLPHAVPHCGPGYHREGDRGNWDTQGTGSVGGPKGAGGLKGTINSEGTGVPGTSGHPGSCRGALGMPELPGASGVLGFWGCWDSNRTAGSAEHAGGAKGEGILPEMQDLPGVLGVPGF